MEEDNDTQQEVPIPEGSYGSLICNGHYPLTMEGTLNYFYSSPQGTHSHFEPPKSCNGEETESHEGYMGFVSCCL